MITTHKVCVYVIGKASITRRLSLNLTILVVKFFGGMVRSYLSTLTAWGGESVPLVSVLFRPPFVLLEFDPFFLTSVCYIVK